MASARSPVVCATYSHWLSRRSATPYTRHSGRVLKPGEGVASKGTTGAKPGRAMGARTRRLLLVMVVGETARAANWGLNGYARQTTPELAALTTQSTLPTQPGQAATDRLLNFSDATA